MLKNIQIRVAILTAINNLGQFIPEEVPLEAKELSKVRVTMDEVCKVIDDLVDEGILEWRKGDVGPKDYLAVMMPATLSEKIDYAVLQ